MAATHSDYDHLFHRNYYVLDERKKINRILLTSLFGNKDEGSQFVHNRIIYIARRKPFNRHIAQAQPNICKTPDAAAVIVVLQRAVGHANNIQFLIRIRLLK